MLDQDGLPRIQAPFDSDSNADSVSPSFYVQIIKQALKRMLPPNFFAEESDTDSHFPWISSTPMQETPCSISFYYLMKSRPNAFKFFYEMISRWLVPGTKFNVLLVYNVDFRLPDISQDLYNLCEVIIRVEDPCQLDQIQKNYPIIESEISLGLCSPYYAQKILEIKGLSVDEKAAYIQEQIAYVVERFPSIFDQTIFAEMQHVLMIASDEFKAARESRHLTRIISLHYLFRKELRDKVKLSPHQRHHRLKIFQAKIGSKTVVGLLGALSFLRDKELFEQRHFLKAILTHLPGLKVVENSYFSNRRGSELITTLYLEIEKENGDPITHEEINLLRTGLSKDLSQHIEDLLPPIFMPRNEEEIMRHIMSLSNQIKYVRDLPQVVITYDNQTHKNLHFTVIIVRLQSPAQHSIKQTFEQGNTFIEYIHDRNRKVGELRKKYTKEATVFRVKFSKDNFIRVDHSVDISKARHAIISEITRLLGPVRDFNGGMITKQTELFTTLKALLKQENVTYNEWLLENFFYSLSPPSMRAVIEPKALLILVIMMLAALHQIEGYPGEGAIRMNSREEYVCILITSSNSSLKEELAKVVQSMGLPKLSCVSSYIKTHEIHCIGYIFHSLDPEERDRFTQTLVSYAAPAFASKT